MERQDDRGILLRPGRGSHRCEHRRGLNSSQEDCEREMVVEHRGLLLPLAGRIKSYMMKDTVRGQRVRPQPGEGHRTRKFRYNPLVRAGARTPTPSPPHHSLTSPLLFSPSPSFLLRPQPHPPRHAQHSTW